MPAFITRVELHGADGTEYEILHREMQRRGFHRQVLSGDRTIYDLPSAMYQISETDLKATTVRDLAREAAHSTSKRFWIFTDEYISAAWVLHPTDDAEWLTTYAAALGATVLTRMVALAASRQTAL